MKKVYFFEGINGSGKSTIAKKTALKIRCEHPEVRVFLRSEKPSPIDMCRLAWLSENEFDRIVYMISENCSLHKNLIRNKLMQFSSYEDTYYVVNWYDFLYQNKLLTSSLMEFFHTRELCDGRADLELYKEITYKRFQRFASSVADNTVFLFEGALFQHPITELLGYYLADEDIILDFIVSLLDLMSGISTEVIYISVDNVEDIIMQASKARMYDDFSWLDGFVKLTTSCNFGTSHKLEGFSGAVKFCKERIRIEKKILNEISVSKKIICR